MRLIDADALMDYCNNQKDKTHYCPNCGRRVMREVDYDGRS